MATFLTSVLMEWRLTRVSVTVCHLRWVLKFSGGICSGWSECNVIPYSRKFRRVQCFTVFTESFLTRKKNPWNFEHMHSKQFTLCTWGQTADKEALERKQDLAMSIYRYLWPVNSLPQPDGPLSSSLPSVESCMCLLCTCVYVCVLCSFLYMCQCRCVCMSMQMCMLVCV